MFSPKQDRTLEEIDEMFLNVSIIIPFYVVWNQAMANEEH